MNYLEKIAPSYFELLMPLKKWRILSVKDLKEQSGHNGSRSSFYKVITKLESYLLIDSFINSWSNEKFIYLMPNAIKVLGEEKVLPVNRDQRFHDAIVTKIALNFKDYNFVKDIYLDQEIGRNFPLIKKNPDILIVGQIKKDFKLAVEIELTQKNKSRVQEIFRSYSKSIAVNNIIYITDKLGIYNTYLRYLNELSSEINTDKFIFIYEKDLNNKTFNIINSKALYRGYETSLKQLFTI
ncbi:MAG: hypothetical protein VYA54_01200 [Bdellovibrionota bacterium]|nr:hypothetical protein [Bdellovibrionota bacterium]